MSYIYWEKYVHPLYLTEFLHELNLIGKHSLLQVTQKFMSLLNTLQCRVEKMQTLIFTHKPSFRSNY